MGKAREVLSGFVGRRRVAILTYYGRIGMDGSGWDGKLETRN